MGSEGYGMVTMLRDACSLVWLAAGLTTSLAHAQNTTPTTTSASEAALARELARTGVAAAQDARWADALEAFRRSYALAPKPAMALNLASAEARTGHLVDALEHYRRVTDAPAGEVDEEERSAARDAADGVLRRVAHLRVVVRALRSDDRVDLDGAPLSHAALDADLPVDPGRHAARLVRLGTSGPAEAASAERVLAEGEHALVALEAPPEPARPVAPPRTTLFSSPWFWTAVGVVAAGGLVTVGCVVSFCQEPSAHPGSLGAVKLP
jgi:hypothetical protein